MTTTTEQVICVSSHTIQALFGTHKSSCPQFLPSSHTTLSYIANLIEVGQFTNGIFNRNPILLPRSNAETNETFKHLITYTVITHGDTIFSYRRSPKGGEGRLHGLRSIGVGGHVTKEDVKEGKSWEENLKVAAYREVTEETHADYCTPPDDFRYVGALSDDSNPVGRVHLGLVFELNLTNPVIPKEDHLTNHEYQRINDVVVDDYESWSAILLNKVMKGPRPTFF